MTRFPDRCLPGCPEREMLEGVCSLKKSDQLAEGVGLIIPHRQMSAIWTSTIPVEGDSNTGEGLHAHHHGGHIIVLWLAIHEFRHFIQYGLPFRRDFASAQRLHTVF